MLRTILVVLALLIAMPAAAQRLDLDGLPADVKADILEKANRAKETAIRESTKKVPEVKTVPDVSEISKKTREELDAWGALGTGAGKAIVSAAKELGMAANEFAGTGLGKFIIVLIAFKVVGVTLLNIAVGSILWAVGLWTAWQIIKPYKSVEYAHVPFLWGLGSRKRVVAKVAFTDKERGSDETITRILMGGVMMAIVTFVSLKIIL